LLPESIEKLFVIDDHIAAVSAGLVGDARRIIQLARQKAQENLMYYEEPIKVETLTKEIANIMQIFTQYGGMRPFGIAMLVGGVDESGSRLFETEPSGALAEYKAAAVGKNKAKATEALEKSYSENMTLDEGINLIIEVLKKGLEEKEKLEAKRLDFAYVDSKMQYTKVSADKLKAFLDTK
jgi:proteasome alpha subunit